MSFITAKFGGSSLADAAQIKKASAIIKSNPDTSVSLTFSLRRISELEMDSVPVLAGSVTVYVPLVLVALS